MGGLDEGRGSRRPPAYRVLAISKKLHFWSELMANLFPQSPPLRQAQTAGRRWRVLLCDVSCSQPTVAFHPSQGSQLRKCGSQEPGMGGAHFMQARFNHTVATYKLV